MDQQLLHKKYIIDACASLKNHLIQVINQTHTEETHKFIMLHLESKRLIDDKWKKIKLPKTFTDFTQPLCIWRSLGAFTHKSQVSRIIKER